uniref:Uncharacterized protein n=2 Tax=Panagrolaimus sp. PS1159 TaxID=55785 RepID=A0AC35EYR0_9BILA
MLNLNSLRQLIGAVYDELPNIPIALRADAVPSPESLTQKFLESFAQKEDGQDLLFRLTKKFLESFTQKEDGQDLLFRYKLGIYQIRDLNSQAFRYANQTSTRMSAVQQSVTEHWETVTNLQENLTKLPQLSKQLDEINRSVTELERFMAQTQIAFLSLEALDDQIKDLKVRRQLPSLMDVS